MRNTNRLIALALCFTLTLGTFAYRPPEAKAVAGVDDAVVIGALLSAFAGGCGLIFSNNGMSSNEIAQGLTAKWNDFKETLASVPADFPAWLGYDSMDALITDLRWDEVKDVLSVPLAVARKFADFTDWFVNDLGVSPDSGSKPFCSTAGGTELKLLNGGSITLGVWSDSEDVCAVTPGSVLFYVTEDMYSQAGSLSWDFTFLNGQTLRLNLVLAGGKPVLNGELFDSSGARIGTNDLGPSNGMQYLFWYGAQRVYAVSLVSDVNGNIRLAYYGTFFAYQQEGEFIWATDNPGVYSAFCRGLTVSELNAVSSSATDFSAGTNAGVQTPDLADDAETAPTPTITGVGWDAATIEELLQQILDQLQANTLATTISVDAAQTGGETGTDTDEDAKPYLPFIPQIFEKVKEIPGTLSNIWDTVKGLPAAIAEKISAFFTTLWGWLQDIITEIKALPAAIAEKVKALFTPDEALVTEITDTFKGKFGFLSTLKQFANDLFGMTADSEPPVIWVHLENAESKFGYTYGDKQKILDLAWYQKYKANVDTIISGFLWLSFLWLLFKRAPSIIQGSEMVEQYSTDISVGHREKGGKKK